jgi:hypothetical protein
MCSPPPKPISSQTSSACGARSRGSNGAWGARICGSKVSTRAAWRGLIGRDLIRP